MNNRKRPFSLFQEHHEKDETEVDWNQTIDLPDLVLGNEFTQSMNESSTLPPTFAPALPTQSFNSPPPLSSELRQLLELQNSLQTALKSNLFKTPDEITSLQKVVFITQNKIQNELQLRNQTLFSEKLNLYSPLTVKIGNQHRLIRITNEEKKTINDHLQQIKSDLLNKEQIERVWDNNPVLSSYIQGDSLQVMGETILSLSKEGVFQFLEKAIKNQVRADILAAIVNNPQIIKSINEARDFGPFQRFNKILSLHQEGHLAFFENFVKNIENLRILKRLLELANTQKNNFSHPKTFNRDIINVSKKQIKILKERVAALEHKVAHTQHNFRR